MRPTPLIALAIVAAAGVGAGVVLVLDDEDAPARASAATPTTAPASTLPQGADPVSLDPADFSTTIDNPYWPMSPGTRWVYRELEPDGTPLDVVVTVTDQTKLLANGITARVVRDTVTDAAGALVEDTTDWYAQDGDGNVWYLGEDTREYEGGAVVSTAGSFEAGKDGALPGIAMPAAPAVGLAYRQEHLAGEAEDEARVLRLDERVQTEAGSWSDVLVTRDANPLGEQTVEEKLYARGVGPVLSLGLVAGGARAELIEHTPGA